MIAKEEKIIRAHLTNGKTMMGPVVYKDEIGLKLRIEGKEYFIPWTSLLYTENDML